MKITYCNEQEDLAFTPQMSMVVERIMHATAAVLGMDFAVNLLLTDAMGILRLNYEFRGIEGPTDVISFPAYHLQTPILSINDIQYPEWEDGVLFVGDIAIYAARARRQAERYGHSVEREIAFLTLHGVLHLFGYDHMDPMSDKIMRHKQREILEFASKGR